MTIKNKPVSRLSVLTIALMTAFAAQAAEAESIVLDTVKVTGNTITPELNSVDDIQIEKLQANDLEDLFSQSPEVTIGGGPAVAQKLYVRGLEDQLLNITIDGAQQATRQFHHAGRISIEPELLKYVEVNAGAGNALSGPGALGGSVKFVTKDPEDMLKPGENFGGLVKGMISSNTDAFKTNTSLFGRLTDDWSAMVSFTQYDPDNYEDGNGDEVLGTSFDQQYLFAKVVGHISDSQTLRLSYEKRDDEGERSQRPQWVVSDRNPLYPVDVERETVTLNYNINPLDNEFLDLSLTLYNTETELFQDGRYGPYYGTGTSKGFDLRNTSFIGMHTVTYGVDYREDETAAGGAANKSASKDESKVTGVYIQDDIQLTDALLLSAGLRYDNYKLDSDLSTDDFEDDDISHNIGINYHFTDSWSVFASYAEAFKGVQAQDAFKIDFRSIDPDIKPEQAENVEVGVAYESNTWFGSAKAYQSEVNDVVADKDGAFRNIGDLESDGYILELGRRWDGLLARVSYHYNDAEVDGFEANAYDHNGITNTVRDTFTAQLDYQYDAQWNVGWNARFIKGRDDLKSPEVEAYYPGTKVEQPGYGVHDIYVQWQPLTSEDIRVGLTVRNVFDKNYIDHASVADFTNVSGYGIVRGYNEPGRDVRLSVSWQF
ncbi:hypothetical protein LCGC14_1614500 [marine sediment metagenome]|uniref:TonB-dependent receptor n=1 Tax=marine sediment metagenome TaxID=412755 RepID=A0A0F9I7D1_9ZZZZ